MLASMIRAKLPLALTLLTALAANAQHPDLVATPTPPMGWNSWDAFGLTINEQQFRANVAVLRDKLKHFGYRYAVIDEGWYFFNPEDREKPDNLHYALDESGRYVPVAQRFPSAAGGDGAFSYTMGDMRDSKLAATIEPSSTFKPLADYVHQQGLLFGIHIVRGIPRASVERNLPIADSTYKAQDAADTTDACPWDPTNWGVKDTPAGQAWYDSLFRQYAFAPRTAMEPLPHQTALAEGHGELRPLDVFSAELHYACPSVCHPEDWVIAPVPWRLIERPCGKAARQRIASCIHGKGPLLGGFGDRVWASTLQKNPAEVAYGST
jgi:hypothetical protein